MAQADRVDVASRIAQIVTSKTGLTPGAEAFTELSSAARPADKADVVALEVCMIVLRDYGLSISKPKLSKLVRSHMRLARQSTEQRSDRIADIRGAIAAAGMRAPAKSDRGLVDIAAALLGPPDGARFMGPKPLSREDVCQTCGRSSPDNIHFLRYKAKTVEESIQRQLDETRVMISRRLAELGGAGDGADLDVSVVIHRGCCRVHGSDDRRSGDGVAELPGILVRVDFGAGVVVEAEHEVRL